MATFSRWMPPAERPSAGPLFWFGLVVGLGIAAAAVLWAVIYKPPARFIAGGLLALGVIATISETRRLRRLARTRIGEDIGTFARAFDRRGAPFDPWVVRAVWDALQPYLTYKDGRVPLRPSDRLFDDLRLDGDDPDLEIFPEVAGRCGRSVEDVENNPLYGRVATVGDLVQFVVLQPRRDAA